MAEATICVSKYPALPMSAQGQKRPIAERCPNDRYLIRKRPLANATMNGRSLVLPGFCGHLN